ncbi:MAG: hypothetical protein HFACDABA_01324 [Anaerolineales bacterium]|nr:hypothetical protein [Anaerolineales bacterium]
MDVATVTSTYRITIPKEIREKYHLKPGQQVRFEVDGKMLIVHFEESAAKKTSEFLEDSE